jgi:hypothetical membrane protein
MLVRTAASGAALIGAAVGGWGILTSADGLPRYSWRHNFISEIAVPWNPLADRFNTSLEVAGLLTLLFGGYMLHQARTRLGRAGAVLAILAALSAVAVGYFPVTRFWPHMIAAAAIAGFSLASAVVASLAARRATRGADPLARRLGAASLAATAAAALALLLLIGYFLWVSIRVWPGSIDRLLRLLPRELLVDIAGSYYNPLAVLEWTLFATIGAQLIGFAAAELTGYASRVRTVDRPG